MSHHIDYITPGIKLMSGGYDEKIVKRMIGPRHITGDLPRKGRHGRKGKGKGKKKCPPKPPLHPGDLDPMFLVTGPCSDEITPHCIRGRSTW